MKLSEDTIPGAQVINSYDENSITVNEQNHTHSLIISNFQLIPHWPVNNIQQLSNQTLQTIIELEPEVIIIGTGKTIQFPRPENYSAVINLGIGIEFMDLGAACRTYNILLSENRKIAAGIILQ